MRRRAGGGVAEGFSLMATGAHWKAFWSGSDAAGSEAVNLWIALLVIILAFCLEWHGYSEGKKKGFQRGYCRGRTDSNLWWIKLEEQADQARQEIWRENT